MELSIVFQILGWIALGIIAYTIYENVNPLLTKRTQAVPFPPEMTEQPQTVRFLYFSAPWCPWSKKARPQWDAFKEDMKLQPVTFGGKTVVLEEIDGDIEVEKRKQYGVSAYPSFKLVTPEGVKEMTTIPTRNGMRDFLLRNLGPEEPVQLTTRNL